MAAQKNKRRGDGGPAVAVGRRRGRTGYLADAKTKAFVVEVLTKLGATGAAKLLNLGREVPMRIATDQGVQFGSLVVAEQAANTIDLAQVG